MVLDLWSALAAVTPFLLLAVLRPVVWAGIVELRIWLAWSKLPHTHTPWGLSGDLPQATSFERHRFYPAWAKQLGGIFGIRLGPICVSQHSRRKIPLIEGTRALTLWQRLPCSMCKLEGVRCIS